jgi:Fe-S-cluster containining protein
MAPFTVGLRESMERVERDSIAYLSRQGRTPSCTRGCCACCEMLVTITWPEAFLLAEDLRARGQVALFLPDLLEQARKASFQGVDSATYWQRRIRCALLLPDGDCALYATRPAPCRLYFAFGPPNLCASRNGHTICTGGARSFGMALAEQLSAQGFERAYEFAPLPLMVLGALRELGEDLGQDALSPSERLRRYGDHVTTQDLKRKR